MEPEAVSAALSHHSHEAAFAGLIRLENRNYQLKAKEELYGGLVGPRHIFNALGTRHQPSSGGFRNMKCLTAQSFDADYSQLPFIRRIRMRLGQQKSPQFWVSHQMT
jgi:hypothetical protein